MFKILVVEDDVFLSSLLKNRLIKEGFEVAAAKDGEEALDFLRARQPFDLILLDIILPKKSGFEILEEIRSDPQLQGRKAPIIIISNLGQVEDVVRAQQLGAADYFVKTKTSIDDLVKKVNNFIESFSRKAVQV